MKKTPLLQTLPTPTLKCKSKPTGEEKTTSTKPKTTKKKTLKSEAAQEPTPEAAKEPTPQQAKEKEQINFYSVELDKEDCYKGFHIKLVELTENIRDLGFCRFDLDNEVTLFVHVSNKVVRNVTIREITDALIAKVERSRGCEYVSVKAVKERLYGNLARYFSPQLLQRIQPQEPFNFVKDTRKEAFFCFTNGVVVCDKNGYQLKPYTDFNQHIWDNQIIKRDFEPLNDMLELLENSASLPQVECPIITEYGHFARFCYLLAGDSERFTSLCSLLGYALHDFTDYKLHAVVLTDSVISEDNESNGRSGKTLLFRALKHIRNQAEINGKDFVATNKHKYDSAKIDTQLVFINDLKRKFDVEDLFNDVTEGITVDIKNQQPFKIEVKMLLTCNQALKVEGDSAKDRFIEFDITNHFHVHHTPEMEFGHWFFRDWNSAEWNKFDNFMLFCVCLFLQNGIVEPRSLNLHNRKLIEYTSPEFITFFDEKVKAKTLNGRYEKGWLLEELQKSFPDLIWLKQRLFTKWLRKYVQESPVYAANYQPYDKKVNESRSNSSDFYHFFPLAEETSDQQA